VEDAFDRLFDDPASAAPLTHIGRLVGTVRLERILSERSTCDVYLGVDELLGRHVALKVLRLSSDEDSIVRRRFLREAQIMAKMRHPGVVQLLGLETLDGYPCLVMEYMNGGCLEQALRNGLPTIPDAVEILFRIASAVESAHSLGVVHRDLKPSNILLDTSISDPGITTALGYVKVADFGISRLIENFEDLTLTGAQPGTVLYMSPEQVEARSSEVGPATDVFALGALLYRMLSGSSPFAADSMAESVQKIVSATRPRLKDILPTVPDWLDTVCSRCLQLEPGGRYSSAGELAAVLGQYRTQAGRSSISRNHVLLAIGFALLLFALIYRIFE
jgi:serine/threonine-protein kinase